MKQLTLKIQINKSVGWVSEFCLNPNNTPKWIDSIIEEETSEWPVKLGSIYKNTGDGKKWDEYVLTELEENKMFVMTSKDGRNYHVKYTFNTKDNNSCEFEYFEWVDKGELENPFTISHLNRLKSVIEETNEYVKLNIAIIPSKEIAEYAVKVSKELSKKYTTEFTLDGKNYFPHITIYPLEVETGKVKEIVTSTMEVIKKISKINIEFGKFWSVSDNGEHWVGIPVIKQEKLMLLNKQVVNGVNLVEKTHSLAFETYNPHLTIASFTEKNWPSNIVLPQFKNKTMEVNKIGIFEMGNHGTCKKLIEEFKIE